MERSRDLKLRDSIVLRLLKVVFIIYFFVTFTVTCFHLAAEYNQAREHLKEDLRSFQTIFEPGLAAALWNLDEQQVASNLSGMLKSPIIQGIRLKLVDNTSPKAKVWDVGHIPMESETFSFTNQTTKNLVKEDFIYQFFSHSFEVFYETQDSLQWLVGQATLYTNRQMIINDVETSFRYIIVNAIIKTIVLWTLFLIAGRLYLSRPLEKLITTVEKIHLKSIENLPPEIAQTGKDELQALETAFNDMIRKLNKEVRERKQYQSKLKEAKEFLDNIIESMPLVLIGVDVKLSITHWNEQARSLTKVPEKQAVGQHLLEVFPAFIEHVPSIQEALSQKRAVTKYKTKLEIKDEDKTVDLTIYPLITEKNEGAVIVFEDVTQRIRLEEMMVQTEKMRMVAGLGAGVAHEINNPLGIILQNAQNIERRLAPSLPKNQEVANKHHVNLQTLQHYLDNRGIPEFIDNIQEAGKRASKIIQNMLQLSRSSQPEFKAASIRSLVESAIELAKNDYELAKKYHFEKIQITEQFDDTIPDVPCERSQMIQVLFNLIKNAAQAMAAMQQESQPLIHIKTRRTADTVLISLTDNGPGMSKETKERLFEPFYTTKPVGDGTGLGLYVSYFIITTVHKGHIHVESKLDKGTSFTIEIPLTYDELVKSGP